RRLRPASASAATPKRLTSTTARETTAAPAAGTCARTTAPRTVVRRRRACSAGCSAADPERGRRGLRLIGGALVPCPDPHRAPLQEQRGAQDDRDRRAEPPDGVRGVV